MYQVFTVRNLIFGAFEVTKISYFVAWFSSVGKKKPLKLSDAINEPISDPK